MTLLALVSAVAAAQVFPAVDADAWTASLGSAPTLITEDTVMEQGTAAIATTHWGHGLPTSTGGSRRLEDVFSFELGGTWTSGPARIGLVAPVHVQPRDIKPRMGDLVFSALVVPDELPGGVLVRITAPLGAADGALGEPRVSTQLGLVAASDVGMVRLALNGGYHWKEGAPGSLTLVDDELWGRLGLSADVRDDLALSAELASSVPLWGSGGVPVELLLGVHRTSPAGDVQRLGIAAGTGGVGAPTLRVVLGTRLH